MTRLFSRRIVTAAAVAATAALLAGCSAGAPNDDAGSASPAAGGGAFPVTIEHAYGETTIPSAPERVIALGVTDSDPLIALGTVPVGNSGYQYYETGLGPWALEAAGDAELTYIESDDSPNLEQIAALDPDLILGVTAGFDDATYAKLSQIAPTVARPKGDAVYSTDRATQTEIIATAMGMPERGKELNADVDAAIEKTKADHPDFVGKTGAVILPYDNQYAAFLPGDARGQFLTSIGFEIPKGVLDSAKEGEFFAQIPYEQVELFDGDLILIIGEVEDQAILDGTGLYASMNAVKNKAVLQLTQDQRGAISYNSVLSIPYALDSLVPQIAKLVS